jgi:predicted kinase
MSTLTLLVGSPGSDKVSLAREIAQAQSRVMIRADGLRQMNGSDDGGKSRYEEVTHAILLQLGKALATGKPIVLDDVNRTPKLRKPYLELARRFGYRTEAVFLNVTLEEATAFAEKQAQQGGRAISEQELRKWERNLRIPTYAEGFDRIEVRTSEQVVEEAREFFQEQESRLIENPVKLIRELEADGRLERWIPELYRAIPIDQHNPHHRFTIYEHILKATEVVAGSSLKMVWTMLLHDIGKAYPGIKQFIGVMKEDVEDFKKGERVIIENGADIREGRDSGEFYLVRGQKIPKEFVETNLVGHFYEHENLGAQLSFRVLTRLGYPHDFALEVATLIQFHMLLPRQPDEVALSQLRSFYDKVGAYAGDLMWVRLADDRGK